MPNDPTSVREALQLVCAGFGVELEPVDAWKLYIRMAAALNKLEGTSQKYETVEEVLANVILRMAAEGVQEELP